MLKRMIAVMVLRKGVVVKAQFNSLRAKSVGNVLLDAGGLRWWLLAVVLVIVAVVFWPVVHGDFVWDDWPSFHDSPWLTRGDLWLQYVFKGFNSWAFYFRPLGVLVFTAEVRLFHSTPGPMHVVSLAMHLLDVSLVGMLALRAASDVSEQATRVWLASFAMALYGLHPLLIEPVSWVGCQFDLLATMLMLVGLLIDGKIGHRYWRALAVSASFFLAACAKESAAAFPAILVVWNWLLRERRRDLAFMAKVRVQLSRDGLTLVGICLAGMIYLGLRSSLLGGTLGHFSANRLSPFGWIQEACYTYVRYLRGMIWPMAGMGPVHWIDYDAFAHFSWTMTWHDAAALIIVGSSVYLFICRRSIFAGLILLATAALSPVLHIIPVQFENSYYHERYAMTALAVVCAALPLFWPLDSRLEKRRDVLLMAAAPLLFLWLMCSVIGIRYTIPRWANDVDLWTWAYGQYPFYSPIQDNLVHAYIHTGDLDQALGMEDRLFASGIPCTSCMMQLAKLNLDEGDVGRASIALDRLRQSPLLGQDRKACGRYYLLTARMLFMKGDRPEARRLLDMATQLLPGDAEAESLLKSVRTTN